jgi:hypothetical protein
MWCVLKITAARIAAIREVSQKRSDVDGFTEVDVEAASVPVWKRWVESLSPKERTALSVWRAGAVSAPTRGILGPDPTCWWCEARLGSARHLFAECPQFEADRRRIGIAARLPETWWKDQPRITAKSGWITFAAEDSVSRRAVAMIAACKLGVEIVQACWLQRTKVASPEQRFEEGQRRRQFVLAASQPPLMKQAVQLPTRKRPMAQSASQPPLKKQALQPPVEIKAMPP